MTAKINIIKYNKFILRDYIAVIKEINFNIEKHIEELKEQNDDGNNDEQIELAINKIEKLNAYKLIFKEYHNNNYSNVINDDDLSYIVNIARLTVDEQCIDYPSIFNENNYNILKQLLNEISIELCNKGLINDDKKDFITDYLNNSNNYNAWLVFYHQCCYILFCNAISIPIIYNDMDEVFNNIPKYYEQDISQWPYSGSGIQYFEYLEVLYSLYDADYNDYINNEINNNTYFGIPYNNNINNLHVNNRNVVLLRDSEDESESDDEIIENPLSNKYSLINNNEIYDCGICFNDELSSDYFKCNTCIFKICPSCYSNYHLKYKIDKCSMCRT